MSIVEAFNVLEDRYARLRGCFEVISGQQLTFQAGKKALAIALSKQSPTDPIEGRTPICLQRVPNATEVYWAISIGRRNISSKEVFYGTTTGAEHATDRASADAVARPAGC